MTSRSGTKSGPGRTRRAAAVVEMAVVAPLLFAVLFGIIEYGWVFTIKQGLTNATREGARVAVLPGSTDAEILERVNNYLAPLGVTTHTIELTRATTETPVETVHVFVPYADVTLIGEFFGSTDYNLGSTCSMRKEGVD